MWDVLWDIVVVVVLAGVALLFIADALSQKTAAARIAMLVAIAAGVALGLEIWKPWLPAGLTALAAALYIAGHANRGESSRERPAQSARR